MSNYAIVETGAKQYWVEKDSILEIELLPETEGKKEIELTNVLFAKDGDNVQIGQPALSGAKVVCENLGEFRAKKVISFKFRRRKASESKRGHRQDLLRLKVKEIQI
jgi:large subunit ribosomal protein L21